MVVKKKVAAKKVAKKKVAKKALKKDELTKVAGGGMFPTAGRWKGPKVKPK